MTLKINDYNFGIWLLPKIQSYFINTIKQSKLIKWDIYLNELDIPKISKRKLSAKNVLISGIHNLIIVRRLNEIIITINDNVKLYGYDITVSSLCKLINYGNQEMIAYPIFTDTFKHFKDNINEYYTIYTIENL